MKVPPNHQTRQYVQQMIPFPIEAKPRLKTKCFRDYHFNQLRQPYNPFSFLLVSPPSKCNQANNQPSSLALRQEREYIQNKREKEASLGLSRHRPHPSSKFLARGLPSVVYLLHHLVGGLICQKTGEWQSSERCGGRRRAFFREAGNYSA